MTRIPLLLIALLAPLVASPAAAQKAPALSLEQTMQLRCSAAFAIIADEQRRGVKSQLTYPPLEVRGKEFAVQAGARLMDELELSQAQYQALFQAQVEALQMESIRSDDAEALVESIMRPCLAALDASGL